MNANMYRSLQQSWVSTRKSRALDKKGLAVALTFLVAMFFGARACSDRTTEQVSSALQEQPDLSAEITIRPAGKNVLEEETAQPVQSLAGLTGALHDPRQRR